MHEALGGSCDLGTLSVEEGGMEIQGRGGDLAQCVKALTVKPDDLSLIPGIYMVDGENTDSGKLSFDFHM